VEGLAADDLPEGLFAGVEPTAYRSMLVPVAREIIGIVADSTQDRSFPRPRRFEPAPLDR